VNENQKLTGHTMRELDLHLLSCKCSTGFGLIDSLRGESRPWIENNMDLFGFRRNTWMVQPGILMAGSKVGTGLQRFLFGSTCASLAIS